MGDISGILWFLIIGAVFYWMMKKGGCCGGGHSHGGGPSDKEKEGNQDNGHKGHKSGCH